MPQFRKMAKKVGGAVKRAYKKRYVKKGKTNYNKIAKDVMYLKSVLNPEKKKYQLTITDGSVGQCDVNGQGFLVQDITPVPAQGTTSVTRNGNSLKLNSSYIKFQFQAMSTGNGSGIRFRIMVVKTIGNPVSAGLFPQTMFSSNSFITSGGVNAGIIDYNSDRREDTFKQFIVVRSKVVSIRPNQHTGQTGIVNCAMGIRYKSHHVKFTSDGSQAVSDGQLYLIILADSGNRNAVSPSSLVGTSQIGVSTGALVQMDATHWFYDN